MKTWYKAEYQVYVYNFCSINLLCHGFWYFVYVRVDLTPSWLVSLPNTALLNHLLCAVTANILHSICYWPNNNWASLVAQTVKNLPAMQETWVQSLGQEDPLEKGMATHFSILAWRMPWTEKPGGPQSTGSQNVKHDWVTNIFKLWCTASMSDVMHNINWERYTSRLYIATLLI